MNEKTKISKFYNWKIPPLPLLVKYNPLNLITPRKFRFSGVFHLNTNLFYEDLLKIRFITN